MRILSLALSSMLICSTVYAAKVYKHIPFNIKVTPEDTVVVNYDFTEKTGIHCSSSLKNASIDFEYKGHDKTANLLVILQSDHIPQRNIEQLADVEGQFKITFNLEKIHEHGQRLFNKEYEVSCVYLGEKSFEY